MGFLSSIFYDYEQTNTINETAFTLNAIRKSIHKKLEKQNEYNFSNKAASTR